MPSSLVFISKGEYIYGILLSKFIIILLNKIKFIDPIILLFDL